MENNKSWIVIVVLVLILTGLLTLIVIKKLSNTSDNPKESEKTEEKQENKDTIDHYNDARVDTFQNEVRTVYRAAQNQFLLDSIYMETNENIIYTNDECNEDIEGAKYTNITDITGAENFKYLVELTYAGQVIKIRATNGTYSYKYDNGVTSATETGIRVEEIVIRDSNGLTSTNQLNTHESVINVCTGNVQ